MTEIDTSNLTGFSEHLFKVLDRFRAVAIDNHISGGSLDDLTFHETGMVDGNTLVNHYEAPVVFSVFNNYEGEADTIRKETDTFTVDVAVFGWNFNRQWNLENVVRLIAEVVDNVEANRTLTDSNGQDPVAEDVNWNSLEADFRFSDGNDMVIHWASVTFEIRTRRLRPA